MMGLMDGLYTSQNALERRAGQEASAEALPGEAQKPDAVLSLNPVSLHVIFVSGESGFEN